MLRYPSPGLKRRGRNLWLYVFNAQKDRKQVLTTCAFLSSWWYLVQLSYNYTIYGVYYTCIDKWYKNKRIKILIISSRSSQSLFFCHFAFLRQDCVKIWSEKKKSWPIKPIWGQNILIINHKKSLPYQKSRLVWITCLQSFWLWKIESHYVLIKSGRLQSLIYQGFPTRANSATYIRKLETYLLD